MFKYGKIETGKQFSAGWDKKCQAKGETLQRAVFWSKIFAVTPDTLMFKKCMRCDMKFITKHSMEEHVRLVHPDVVSSSARRFGKEIEILPSGS